MEKEKEKEREKLDKALLKVALGFQVAEVTEEFAEVDGALKLTKRKHIKKDVPPDLKAVQLLLSEYGGGDISLMSDEQLEEEKARLLSLLGNEEKIKEGGQVCVEVKKKAKTVKKKTAKKSSVKKKKVED